MSYTADVALSFFEWCKVKFPSLQKLDFVFLVMLTAYILWKICFGLTTIIQNQQTPKQPERKFPHLEEPTIFGNQNLVDCFMYQGKPFF